MDRAFIPPRSTSTSDSDPSLSPNTHPSCDGSEGQRQGSAASGEEEQLGLRRGNSDSVAVVADRRVPRLEFGEPSGIGDETFTEFLASTTTSSVAANDTRSSSSRAVSVQAGEQRWPAYGSDQNTTPDYRSAWRAVAASRKRYASTSDVSNTSMHKRSTPGARPTTPPERIGRPGETPSNPIDLISPNPSRGVGFDGASTARGQQHSSNRADIQLPPWQPDNEVDHCPVCRAAFGFWNRKHHCRKCGKVVCDGCSRHRITIPRQYIVQPPPNATPSPFSSTFSALGVSPPSRSIGIPPGLSRDPLNSASSQAGTSGVGAASNAEVVRVCNPCVPDPNLSPPPQTPVTGPLDLPPSYSRYNPSQYPPNQIARLPATMRPPPIPERRGSGLQGFGSSSNFPPMMGGGERPIGSNSNVRSVGGYSSHQNLSNAVPPNVHPGRRATMASSWSRLPNVNYPSSMYRASGILPLPVNLAHRPSRSAAAVPTQPASQGFASAHPAVRFPTHQPPPRREIPEEDECPICGRELPPRGENGDTKEREKHVENCINLHSFSSSTPSAAANTSASASVPTQTGTPYPNRARSTSNNDVPSQGAEDMFSVHPAFRTTAASSYAPASSSAPPADPLPPPAPHRGRMIIYRANEKDCLGEDGETQECIICFEEFEPGHEMGRLECWCKFHRACIRQWWETKGPGSCPTHQLHD